jgi:hypothetical protein
VDAEPLWRPAGARRFSLVAEADPLDQAELAASADVSFRWRPAVLSVPAPNSAGRDVNLIRYATDASLAGRVGIGWGMELTAVVPAGLYQRGAGIKGVTTQAATSIAAQSLHDPRIGYGYALPLGFRAIQAKLVLELALPFGNAEALNGEPSAVTAPGFSAGAQSTHWFGGAQVGLRLRRTVDFYGTRLGSQALLALGAGFRSTSPRLSFTLEAYALPSLVAAGATSYVASEWLGSARYAPGHTGPWSFGLSAGTGLPLSSDSSSHFAAFGVPAFRGSLFVRFNPGAD